MYIIFLGSYHFLEDEVCFQFHREHNPHYPTIKLVKFIHDLVLSSSVCQSKVQVAPHSLLDLSA